MVGALCTGFGGINMLIITYNCIKHYGSLFVFHYKISLNSLSSPALCIAPYSLSCRNDICNVFTMVRRHRNSKVIPAILILLLLSVRISWISWWVRPSSVPMWNKSSLVVISLDTDCRNLSAAASSLLSLSLTGDGASSDDAPATWK